MEDLRSGLGMRPLPVRRSAATESFMPPEDLTGEKEFVKTTKRAITRRGVLWLGQTCNIRCHFCYFLDRIKSGDHPEHPFMSQAKAETICFTLRHYYNNNAIDIQGGEPLLFKGIYDLVSFCDKIGLHPTLITNGILLADRGICVKLKEAGVRDLLISVHALEEVYDSIVGTPGASKKQMLGIRNCREFGIPFRFNVVLSKWALRQYVDIARLAVETCARVVNFIAFNPFEDQASGKRSTDNVARYTEVAEELSKALDVLDDADVEANVRYLPICMVKEHHRKSVYDFQQLPYDLHEWDYASWSWTGQTEQRMRDCDCTAPITLEEATYAYGRPLDALPFVNRLPFFDAFADAKRYVYEKLAGYPRIRLATMQAYHKVLEWAFARAASQGRSAYTPCGPDPALYRENGRLRAKNHCQYLYSPKCSQCRAKPICDGFHGDYVAMFSADEASPIGDGETIDDPCRFTAAQRKVVEKRDYEWFFGSSSEAKRPGYVPSADRCAVCGSDHVTRGRHRSDGEIVSCSECGHLFVVCSEKVDTVIEARYQGLSYWEQDRHHQGIRSLTSEQEWVGFVSARWAALKEHEVVSDDTPERLRVLEIGCSEGRVLAELKKKGHLVLGLEPNREVALLGRNEFRIPILDCSVESCEFPENAFDLILSFHCLEHLMDPARVVLRCFGWLAPGGKLLFEVPVGDDEIDNMDHFHFFSSASATRITESVFGNARLTESGYRRIDGKDMRSVLVSAQKRVY